MLKEGLTKIMMFVCSIVGLMFLFNGYLPAVYIVCGVVLILFFYGEGENVDKLTEGFRKNVFDFGRWGDVINDTILIMGIILIFLGLVGIFGGAMCCVAIVLIIIVLCRY